MIKYVLFIFNLEVKNLKEFRIKNIYLIILLTIACIWLTPTSIDAKVDTVADTAIIVDVDTGKILYAKDENEALPPASMTKMMTEYIVLDKINNGEISWDTTTQISDFVFDISAVEAFSGIGLRKNIDYTVKELYEAIAINSDK